MQDKDEKSIITSIARQEGLSVLIITQIVACVLEYLILLMSRGLFEGLKIPALGMFWVKKDRVVHVNNRVEQAKLKQADGRAILRGRRAKGANLSGDAPDS